jgi:hypothetical protein
MSKAELTEEVFEFLNGQALADKQHEAMMLLSVSEDLWPHTAMLSVGEVVAISRNEVRIALWMGTNTTANLKRTGQGTLVLVHNAKAIYIRLSCESLGVLEGSRHPRERFAARVEAFREDIACYADITSGIMFDLKEPEVGIGRWSQTLKELRM